MSIPQLAFEIAREAHVGQVDKQGRDYLEHHLRPVADVLRPFGEEAEAAGWLHDVLEDTALTSSDLALRGVPHSVVLAVESVTRRGAEPYVVLIHRAALSPLGRLVKLADNYVNLSGLPDLARQDPPTAERLRRKYAMARSILTESLSAGSDLSGSWLSDE